MAKVLLDFIFRNKLQLTKLKETFESFPKKPPKPVDEMTRLESKVWWNIEAERQRTKRNIEVETEKLAKVCRELHVCKIRIHWN